MMPRRKQGLTKEFEKGTRNEDESEKVLSETNDVDVHQSECVEHTNKSAKLSDHGSIPGKRRRKTGLFLGDPNIEKNFGTTRLGKDCTTINECSKCVLPTSSCVCKGSGIPISIYECTKGEKPGVQELSVMVAERNCFYNTLSTQSGPSTVIAKSSVNNSQNCIKEQKRSAKEGHFDNVSEAIPEAANQSLVGYGPIMTTFPVHFGKENISHTDSELGKSKFSKNCDPDDSLLENFKNGNNGLSMLSSVYGTHPNSNIETVLCGLKVSAIKDENSNNMKILASTISESTKKSDNMSVKELGQQSTSQFLSASTGSASLTRCDVPSHTSDSKAKLSNIKNPHILEQHISKIISENAAIVETLDPLWTKKSSKINSVIQHTEGETKKTNSSELLKSRHFGEDTSNVSVQAFKSKLHSALLGKSDISNPSGEIKPDMTFTFIPTTIKNNTPGTAANLNTCDSILYNRANFSRTRPLEESTTASEGSVVKSLLCLKQSNILAETEKSSDKHPENPEGSIIKDLLLKTRKPSIQNVEDNKNFKMVTLNGDLDAKTRSPSKSTMPVVYICILCDIGFRSKENLDIHQKHYCKGSKQNEEFTSHILKNQLLGFVGSSSPPLKKRKISEPVMPANRTKILVSSKAVDDLVTRNKMPQLCAIDRGSSVNNTSPNGSTSSGVLKESNARFRMLKSDYLEEVILCTGAVHPDAGGKLLSYDESNVSRSDTKIHMPSVVVTIAKPILNSGGTVVHSSQSTKRYDKVLVNLEMSSGQVKYSSDNIVASAVNLDVSCDRSLSETSSTNPGGVKTNAIYSTAGLYSTISNDSCMQKLKDSESRASPHCTSSVSKSLHVPSVIFPCSEVKQSDCFNLSNLPTVQVTPSLSPLPADTKNETSMSISAKKFLAPTRPTTLFLNKKAGTLIGSTLVSPETPRPKKSRIQMYLNGQAYTYLGMKCSTRPTYCCIYRPQPMFVTQETDPKLSMYSNWQVVPAEKEFLGLTPRHYFSLYNSRQREHEKTSTTCANKLSENLVVTHSSYWSFRLNEDEQKEAQIQAEKMRADLGLQLDPESNSCVEVVSDADKVSTNMEKDNTDHPDVVNSEKQDTHTGGSGTSISSEKESQKTVLCQNEATVEESTKRGFKSNEDYTYIRGRGRGKYVCEECGIRCKKPSMLKKHIRTHTDLRPFKCKHCAFAFKTKGNLTKHMKSKAHHKKCLELGIVPVPTVIDDSQIDGTALSKQFSDVEDDDDDEDMDEDCDDSDLDDEDCDYEEYQFEESRDEDEDCMSEYEVNSGSNVQFEDITIKQRIQHSVLQEKEAAQSLLDLSSLNRPLNWSSQSNKTDLKTENDEVKVANFSPIPAVNLCQEDSSDSNISEQTLIGTPQVLWTSEQLSPKTRPRSFSTNVPPARERVISYVGTPLPSIPETSCFNKEQAMRRYSMSTISETRKMVLSDHCSGGMYSAQSMSHMKNALDGEDAWMPRGSVEQPMDLRISRGTKEKVSFLKLPSRLLQWSCKDDIPVSRYSINEPMVNDGGAIQCCATLADTLINQMPSPSEAIKSPVMLAVLQSEDDAISVNSGILTNGEDELRTKEFLLSEVSENPASPEMQEYNSQLSPISPVSPEDELHQFFPRESFTPNRQLVAPNSENLYHKGNVELLSKRCFLNSDARRFSHRPEMDEGKCTCSICHKTFSKPSQLRLHVNIHYFERPFRCDSCAVSFRTKGHLQKHKRSVSHYNKVNMNITFGTPTTDNPRPFKCADCKIAFRIHGHLAKHLRSKMHIMKLECLGKLPFGMYAEMERSGVNLNEIDTTDCENSLESLQTMAQRLYNLDPRRMRWQSREKEVVMEQEKIDELVNHPQSIIVSPENVAEVLPNARMVGVISSPTNVVQHCAQLTSEKQDVKQELNDFAVDGHGLVTNFLDVVTNPRANELSSVNKRTMPDSESEIPLLHRSCTCHLCGRLFKSAKFLQVHLYYDHQGWTEPVCSNPSELPRSPEELLNWNPDHERQTVADVDGFNCDICGKHFTNCSSLQQHMLSHAQLRPFVCDVCDAGFTTSVLLTAHVATHQQSDCGNMRIDAR